MQTNNPKKCISQFSCAKPEWNSFFTTVTHPLAGLYRKIGRRKGFTFNLLKSTHDRFINFNIQAPAFKEKNSLVTVVKNEFHSSEPGQEVLMHNLGKFLHKETYPVQSSAVHG